MFYGKSNSRLSRHAYSSQKHMAGSQDLEDAITKLSQPVPRKMPVSYRVQVRKFVNNGTPICWDGKIINPAKLDLSNLNFNNVHKKEK